MAWSGTGTTYIWNLQPGDTVVDRDVTYLGGKISGSVELNALTLVNNNATVPDMSMITANDRLYICGHGFAGATPSVGNCSPRGLASLLNNANLTAVGKIVLSSCTSGSKAHWYSSTRSTFAWKFLQELRSRHIQVGEVTGQRGLLFVQPDGSKSRGHRRGFKRLNNGLCRVRMKTSTSARKRTFS